MEIIGELRHRIRNLLMAPHAELGSWARFARGQIMLWRYCVRRLGENNVQAMSSALSFRTIFALVPLVIVAFLALKSLGVVEDSKVWLHDFMEQTGLTQITYSATGDDVPGEPGEAPPPPAPGETSDPAGTPPYDVPERITVAEKIESVVDYAESQLTVGRLGPLSAVLLVWTALTLLMTMERSLNRIFEAPRSRGLARRILIYWSVVTLGPVLIVTAVELGGRLVDSVSNLPVLSWTLGPIGWVAPFVVGVLFLAMVYSLMPNTHVSFRRALEGAVLAVPLWGVARWAFSLYVSRVGSQSLYGALGLLPLFLLWLNLSWWIFLFGAQVAHAAANVERLMRARLESDGPITPWHDLAAVLAVARKQAQRGGPATPADVAHALAWSETRAESLVAYLAEAGVLLRSENGSEVRCGLAVTPDRLQVSRILHLRWADGEAPEEAEARDTVARAVGDVRRQAEAGIENLTVADMMPQRQEDER